MSEEKEMGIARKSYVVREYLRAIEQRAYQSIKEKSEISRLGPSHLICSIILDMQLELGRSFTECPLEDEGGG